MRGRKTNLILNCRWCGQELFCRNLHETFCGMCGHRADRGPGRCDCDQCKYGRPWPGKPGVVLKEKR